MRPTFGREYIENEFQRIAAGLSAPLTVYLMVVVQCRCGI